MVYIRVDANEYIASGHLMRTLSIAETVREEGGNCCFITSDHNCDAQILGRGFETICLNSKWDEMDDEIGALVELIKARRVECLLVDSYYVTPNYLEEISKWTKVVYMDDLKAFQYNCHAIINYVIGEDGKDYSYFKGPIYAGASYVPLRKEFTENVKCSLSDCIKQVMVTTGGTDIYHFGMAFLRRFLNDIRFQNCQVTMVIGSRNADRDQIKGLYGSEPRITIVEDAKNMSQLMKEADCMVSAGGTTLYEACACGVPTISYSMADNQLTNVKQFDKLGGIFYAGDVREDIDLIIDAILDRLQEMKDLETRTIVAEKMRSVVDGKGAVRIARVLLNIYKE